MKTSHFLLSFIILLFFFIPLVRSQNKQYDQTINIIPPSPDAAALGKYGAIPMGLYSGQPQVNVPLYNVSEGDIDINLSLSYSGGGVKVEDISSMVGLGWTLNAGGVITRSVKGKPDDDAGGYFDPTLYDRPRPTLANNVLTDELKWRLATGASDGESDLYYFNIGDYAGSFYFDTNRQPRFFEHSNLKIVPYMTNLRLDSFKVVTEKGIEYIFDQKETQSTSTKSWSTGQGEPAEFVPATREYTSSWYLSKIRSPNGYHVNFEYDPQPKSVVYETMGSERSYFRKDVPYPICP